MGSDKASENKNWIDELVNPIGNDLLSGAAEIALQAIVLFKNILVSQKSADTDVLKQNLRYAGEKLMQAQPAMASLVKLNNIVLEAANKSNTKEEIKTNCQQALNQFEKVLCDDIAKIADTTFGVMPPGEMVFAYSFSSTVVSCLLNAKARGRYFRVACSESRPSMEGRKLANHLTSGGVEVIYTFDSAMAMLLATCSVALMGCDSFGVPGLVNKSGSLLIALACHEMKIPLYAVTDTSKFIDVERFFEFENHQRPGIEVWEDAPAGVTILNRQFELIPFEYLTGLITEHGLFAPKDLPKYIEKLSKEQPVQPVMQ